MRILCRSLLIPSGQFGVYIPIYHAFSHGLEATTNWNLPAMHSVLSHWNQGSNLCILNIYFWTPSTNVAVLLSCIEFIKILLKFLLGHKYALWGALRFGNIPLMSTDRVPTVRPSGSTSLFRGRPKLPEEVTPRSDPHLQIWYLDDWVC